MNCNELNVKLPDLLFDAPASVTDLDAAEAQSHLAECTACREQLRELRATMALLDTWEAPEPNPYFLTRLNARLEEERHAVPAGWPLSWVEKLKARFLYGSRMTMRPVMAMSLTAAILLGGGAYLGLNNWEQPPAAPVQTAVVQDLQTLDSNAPLLDQLESLSDQGDDQQSN